MRASQIRELNFKKSKAAGVAVGEYSELNSPGIGKIPKSWRRKNRTKKGKKKGHKSGKSARGAKDALFEWRRLPGSFENGKKR